MSATRRLRLSILLLILLIGVGVVGYVAIEGWSAFDGLYMTVITLATIGYGETRPLGTAGRAFTIVLILGGVTALGFILRSLAEVVGGEHLRAELKGARMDRRLATVSGHQIICGYGRMGRALCDELLRAGADLVVIEKEPALARELAGRNILHVEGDASDDESLLHAGVKRARCLIAVAPSDEINVFIVLSARALNPALHIVARSEYEHDEHKLRRAGADRVVSPYVIGARQIASAVLQPAPSETPSSAL